MFSLNWYFNISQRKSLSWNSSVKESRAKEMFTMRRIFRRINRRKFVVRVLVLIIASTFFMGNFIQYGRTRQQHMQPHRESKTEKCDCKIGKWLWILDKKEIHGSNKRMTSAVQWNPRSNQDFHDVFTATKRKLARNIEPLRWEISNELTVKLDVSFIGNGFGSPDRKAKAKIAGLIAW